MIVRIESVRVCAMCEIDLGVDCFFKIYGVLFRWGGMYIYVYILFASCIIIVHMEMNIFWLWLWLWINITYRPRTHSGSHPMISSVCHLIFRIPHLRRLLSLLKYTRWWLLFERKIVFKIRTGYKMRAAQFISTLYCWVHCSQDNIVISYWIQ